MSERYDALERLQRLREAGVLTDAEFEAEKRRLLADPAPAEEEAAPAEAERSRLPMYIAVALVAVAIAVAAGIWLGREVRGTGGNEGGNGIAAVEAPVEENLIAAPPPPDVHTLPQEEQAARAFEAAFGQRGSATVTIDGDQVRFEPQRLLWMPPGAVLISEGEAPDAPHASGGHIAIHYLRPAGDRFEVTRRFVPAVTTGSSGKLGEWSVSSRFGERPVITAAGGGTFQGYSCTVLTLTEVGPSGPVELAEIPLSYSDAGAQEDPEEATEIEGKIANVVKGRSFEVVYSGAEEFTERYVRSGGRYVLEGGGETRMRRC